MQIKRTFYTNLEEIRVKANVTQEQLAKELSTTVRTIRRIENMDNAPSVVLAIEISSYFGKTVNEMFWT